MYFCGKVNTEVMIALLPVQGVINLFFTGGHMYFDGRVNIDVMMTVPLVSVALVRPSGASGDGSGHGYCVWVNIDVMMTVLLMLHGGMKLLFWERHMYFDWVNIDVVLTVLLMLHGDMNLLFTEGHMYFDLVNIDVMMTVLLLHSNGIVGCTPPRPGPHGVQPHSAWPAKGL